MKTVILGANGAGKSTLFYHFNGIFKPKSGSVSYLGQHIKYRKKQIRQLRSKVAIILQNPDEQIFEQSVEADIAYGPLNMGFTREEVDYRVEKALLQTGLVDMRKCSTIKLSYGQKKRLAIAGALAMNPEIIIMDEPTAGLDPQMTFELMELVEELYYDGVNVVLSTHDVDLAYSWADEIHVLLDGKLIFSGVSEVFYSNQINVYNAGLILPFIFLMNKSLCNINGVNEFPYPHTKTQLVSKMFSGERGSMCILQVDMELDLKKLDHISKKIGNLSIGLFGTSIRRMIYDKNIDVDFIFDGFESCISECLLGKNTLLICDKSYANIVKSKLLYLEQFGSHIDYKVI